MVSSETHPAVWAEALRKRQDQPLRLGHEHGRAKTTTVALSRLPDRYRDSYRHLCEEKGKLRLALRGSACFAPVSRARAWETSTIVAGSGVFSNAKGHGVIWGTPLQPRYSGLLTLAK